MECPSSTKSSLHFYPCTMFYHTSSSRYQLLGEGGCKPGGLWLCCIMGAHLRFTHHTREDTTRSRWAGGERLYQHHLCIWRFSANGFFARARHCIEGYCRPTVHFVYTPFFLFLFRFFCGICCCIHCIIKFFPQASTSAGHEREQ